MAIEQQTVSFEYWSSDWDSSNTFQPGGFSPGHTPAAQGTVFSEAFHYAFTIQHLVLLLFKARQGFLKQDGENLYSVEIQGPILPHSMVSLMKLLQSGDFTAVCSALSSTKPFASFQSPTAATSAFGKESLSDCGLDRASLDLFCSSQFPQFANEIRFQDGCFHFN